MNDKLTNSKMKHDDIAGNPTLPPLINSPHSWNRAYPLPQPRPYWRRLVVLTAMALTVLIAYRIAGPALAQEIDGRALAPQFTHTDAQSWINSKPLRIEDLRGQVVLIDFWTFDCWNCYRSFPWMLEVERKHHEAGLRVAGVHSPEFEHEKIRANIVDKVAEFKLTHPVMIDNDFSYWRAMQNRYWPTYYLVDRRGRLRAKFIGETHAGGTRALAIEKTIVQLLQEDG